MHDLEPYDLGWVVGLFEGEGCMYLRKQGHPIVQISMTDEDIVRRVHQTVGLGNVTHKRRLTVGGKTVWDWTITRCDDAASFIERVLPRLGTRRREQADRALAAWREATPPRRLKARCVHDHPLSGRNLFVETDRHGRKHRRCRTCRQTIQDRHNARRRALA